MRSSRQIQPDSNPVKDPDEWKTGDEPLTGAQDSYLHTLSQEAGESVPDDLTKAEASKKIEELQAKTGRGVPAPGRSRNSRGKKSGSSRP